VLGGVVETLSHNLVVSSVLAVLLTKLCQTNQNLYTIDQCQSDNLVVNDLLLIALKALVFLKGTIKPKPIKGEPYCLSPSMQKLGFTHVFRLRSVVDTTESILNLNISVNPKSYVKPLQVWKGVYRKNSGKITLRLIP
jgi:hypothetical protein